jgi:hypothetical protein
MSGIQQPFNSHLLDKKKSAMQIQERGRTVKHRSNVASESGCELHRFPLQVVDKEKKVPRRERTARENKNYWQIWEEER